MCIRDSPYTFDQLVKDACGHAYDEWNATYNKHEKGLLRPDGQPGFNTPSGRIELVPSIFTAWGIPPYPAYTPAPETWETTPEVMEEPVSYTHLDVYKRQALSRQDGLLRGQQSDDLHVHGTETLARRHRELP